MASTTRPTTKERLDAAAADPDADLPQEGAPAWESLATDDAPDRHTHWGMHPEQHEDGREPHYPDGQGGIVQLHDWPTQTGEQPAIPPPPVDRRPAEDPMDAHDPVADLAAREAAGQPITPGRQVALVDARTQRALEAVQSLAGLVEIEAFAALFLQHTDRMVGLAELLGDAQKQLGGRQLVDVGLRRKLAEAAREWAEGPPQP